MDMPDEQDIWRRCHRTRRAQRCWGALCALALALALLCVLDGLQALRRTDERLLELLPNGSAAVSGPVPVRAPARGDFQAGFTPEAPLLSFELEGFFTGYIFGGGMWRGAVHAQAGARPGQYTLRVRFRGTPAAATQVFPVLLHPDAAALQAASLSFFRRATGQSPFAAAGLAAGLGLLMGLVVYLQGRSLLRRMTALGCAEVVLVRREGQDAGGRCLLRIWCLLNGGRAPAAGTPCAVLDAQGASLGTARADAHRGNTLELSMCATETQPAVRTGCFVRVRRPGAAAPSGS